VLLVEQNVGALRHADQALVMEKGELVYQGHGDEIRDSARLRETYLGAPA
jgi:ABC-type branched-subunit amino acid transport system ATPase component